MSLEGLRAWIGEVERRLRMRTRVFLALAVIAIGLGGAAIYLAIDTRESSVSEGDVQALQQQLEAQIGTGGGAASADVVQLEAEVKALQAEVDALQSEGGKPQREKGSSGADSGESSGTGGAPSSATGGAPSSAELQKQLQQAQEKSGSAE
jgi:hypothetical protein